MPAKKLVLTAIGAMLLLPMTSAFAVMSLAYGWYIEGNLGASRPSNQSWPTNSSTSQSTLGGNVNVGYKFMPFLGAELGLSYYSSTTIKNQFNTTAGEAKYYSWDFAVKGILPFVDSGFEAFAKLGAQRISRRVTISNQTAAATIGLTSNNKSATGVYLGAGVQYYFTPWTAVVVQWARAEGSNTTGNQDLYTIGLSAIFDC